MKTAVKVLSYTLSIICLIGAFALIADHELDAYSFLAFLLIGAQCVLTLIYIEKK